MVTILQENLLPDGPVIAVAADALHLPGTLDQYLLCPTCRAQYLRKTPAGYRQNTPLEGISFVNKCVRLPSGDHYETECNLPLGLKLIVGL
ncbi:unnamed protein product [Strongylus vulgaris]|uniref:Uncharacterized protein n=1 Tax=Strongylus vulgaris TaxID=40348 RepID=A0A3P7IDS7_STRVU|nr:unnamed protein product [Strongylus vulgaris]